MLIWFFENEVSDSVRPQYISNLSPFFEDYMTWLNCTSINPKLDWRENCKHNTLQPSSLSSWDEFLMEDEEFSL